MNSEVKDYQNRDIIVRPFPRLYGCKDSWTVNRDVHLWENMPKTCDGYAEWFGYNQKHYLYPDLLDIIVDYDG